jgi:hypothetical protein
MKNGNYTAIETALTQIQLAMNRALPPGWEFALLVTRRRGGVTEQYAVTSHS